MLQEHSYPWLSKNVGLWGCPRESDRQQTGGTETLFPTSLSLSIPAWTLGKATLRERKAGRVQRYSPAATFLPTLSSAAIGGPGAAF